MDFPVNFPVFHFRTCCPLVAVKGIPGRKSVLLEWEGSGLSGVALTQQAPCDPETSTVSHPCILWPCACLLLWFRGCPSWANGSRQLCSHITCPALVPLWVPKCLNRGKHIFGAVPKERQGCKQAMALLLQWRKSVYSWRAWAQGHSPPVSWPLTETPWIHLPALSMWVSQLRGGISSVFPIDTWAVSNKCWFPWPHLQKVSRVWDREGTSCSNMFPFSTGKDPLGSINIHVETYVCGNDTQTSTIWISSCKHIQITPVCNSCLYVYSNTYYTNRHDHRIAPRVSAVYWFVAVRVSMLRQCMWGNKLIRAQAAAVDLHYGMPV